MCKKLISKVWLKVVNTEMKIRKHSHPNGEQRVWNGTNGHVPVADFKILPVFIGKKC